MLVRIELKEIGKIFYLKFEEGKANSGYGNDTYIQVKIQRHLDWEDYQTLDVRYVKGYEFKKFVLEWVREQYKHREDAVITTEINTEIGKLYITPIAPNLYLILDSIKRQIGVVNNDFNIDSLREIKHITELVNLEVCDNIIYDLDYQNLIKNVCEEFVENASEDAIETIKENICRVGDMFFIPNFTELNI